MIRNNIYICMLLCICSFFFSCEGDLEPQNFNTLDPSTFFQNADDADAVLTGFYNRFNGGWGGTFFNNSTYMANVVSTDEMYSQWGDGGTWERLNEFRWTPLTSETRDAYNNFIVGVTIGTNTIENLETIPMDEDLKDRFISEVRAGRAIMVWTLFNNYGPPPVVVDPEITLNPNTDFDPERPTVQWTVDFIETELIAAEPHLPARWDVSNFGRFSNAAAKMARLKLYMHQKQWQKAVDVSAEIMALGEYSLVQSSYKMIFDAGNEANEEIIWALPRTFDQTLGPANTWMAAVLPGDFRTETIPANELVSWNGFRTPWSFYDKFETGDDRLEVMIKDYYIDGPDGPELIDGRATGKLAGALPLKYGIDPNREGERATNDLIIWRYADVLMLRAEALNEITPLSVEAQQLVQQVRNRSNAGPIPGSALIDQSSFRDFILDERGREFFCEGVRREDLIRHGKFIQTALDEGFTFASPHHVLFPIPQPAIDANPKIKQNDGY